MLLRSRTLLFTGASRQLGPRYPSTSSRDRTRSVDDPSVVFNSVWNGLESEYKAKMLPLRFPKEIIWLGGAPGSGKGTISDFILEKNEISAPPVIMSRLLSHERFKAAKDQGLLVGDQMILDLLLHTLLDPIYQEGVMVDGVPRNLAQAQYIKSLHDKMAQLRDHSLREGGEPLPRPRFRMCFLFVDEETSVQRQLSRGAKAQKYNAERSQSDPEVEERHTDFSPSLARQRYMVFAEHYDSIKAMQKSFHFSVIDASRSLEHTKASVDAEFDYQSSLELSEQAYMLIREVPTITTVTAHARQQLVTRLDGYLETVPELFSNCIDLISEHIIPVVEQHAIAGQTVINCVSETLDRPSAVDIVLDVLSDRGFHVSIESDVSFIPVRFDMTTGEITNKERTSYKISVRFPQSIIRRFKKYSRAENPDLVIDNPTLPATLTPPATPNSVVHTKY